MSDDKSEVLELVDSAASFAGRLYNALDKVVSLLREDKAKEGLDSFAQTIDGISWFLDAIASINNSGNGDYDIFNFKGFVGEMTEASENMDFVLLADLLEYEILPIIESWGLSLDEILEKQKGL